MGSVQDICELRSGLALAKEKLTAKVAKVQRKQLSALREPNEFAAGN